MEEEEVAADTTSSLSTIRKVRCVYCYSNKAIISKVVAFGQV